jgi:hypothetical protein
MKVVKELYQQTQFVSGEVQVSRSNHSKSYFFISRYVLFKHVRNIKKLCASHLLRNA